MENNQNQEYQYGGGGDYGYQSWQNQPYQNPDSGLDQSPMTIGEWVLTLLALMIPIAGIILYFVWAFSKHGNLNRRNFCRAQLIIMAVVGALYVLLVVVIGAWALGSSVSVY